MGVNKYRLSADDEQEERVDVLKIDNSDVRSQQLTRLNEMKASRDQDAVRDSLANLEKSARSTESTSNGDDPNNLLSLCIACAEARYVFFVYILCAEFTRRRYSSTQKFTITYVIILFIH